MVSLILKDTLCSFNRVHESTDVSLTICLQAPSVQAQVEQHQRGVGGNRGRVLHRRRVILLRIPVRGGGGGGVLGIDDVLAVGAANLVGLEAAAAGVLVLGDRPPERRRGGEASPEESCQKRRN